MGCSQRWLCRGNNRLNLGRPKVLRAEADTKKRGTNLLFPAPKFGYNAVISR